MDGALRERLQRGGVRMCGAITNHYVVCESSRSGVARSLFMHVCEREVISTSMNNMFEDTLPWK